MTLSRGKRMRPRSAGSASAHRARVERLRRTTHGPERCQWPHGCEREAVDAHESLSRARGGDAGDPDWLLCRAHHDAITSASGELLSWAKSVGLIRSAPLPSSHSTVTVRYMPKRTRVLVTRTTDAVGEWVEGLAKRGDTDVATVMRTLLAVAAAHPREIDAKLATIKENG